MEKTKDFLCKTSVFICLIICLTVGTCCFVPGKNDSTRDVQSKSANPIETISDSPPVVNLNDERRLKIDVEVDDQAQFTNIPPERLGKYSDYHFSYLNVSNVSIQENGQTLHLEDAIYNGIISVEEIFAYARIDARNGFCTEKAITSHGLTHFIYRYPKFDLRLTYDIYVTPDRKEHLIKELHICKNAYQLTTLYSDIDREDWGLTFEPVEANSTSLTIDCTQSGGQQLGELTVDHYWIYLQSDEGDMFDNKGHAILNPPGFSNPDHGDHFGPKPDIPRDATTRFTLNWSELYGELPGGRYSMHLSVRDDYDKSQVHPLMQNFQDNMDYWIEFSIS